MTRALTVAALLLALTLGSPATAQDLGGSNVLIPIAGRGAGAFGSQWRTDLVVTNLDGTPVRVYISFYQGTASHFTDRIVPGFGTLVLDDVLFTAFHADGTAGMLRVNSASPDARFVARAYIYNRGSAAGEYGQGVPAMPIDALAHEHVLSGVAGTAGRRTNVGIANPWPAETDVLLTMHGADGAPLASAGYTIPPLTVLQVNDVFNALGVTAVADASIRVHSSLGVYPYASIVRNDSGDAVFVAGSGIRVDAPWPAPVCSDPAALILPVGKGEPEEESIVVVAPETPKQWVLDVVAPRYGFTVDEYFEEAAAFRATLTAQQIAALRCEGSVRIIRRDGVLPF